MIDLSCPLTEETLIASERCKEELECCHSLRLGIPETSTGKGLWWVLLQVVLTYTAAHTCVLWTSMWKSEAEQ